MKPFFDQAPQLYYKQLKCYINAFYQFILENKTVLNSFVSC